MDKKEKFLKFMSEKLNKPIIFDAQNISVVQKEDNIDIKEIENIEKVEPENKESETIEKKVEPKEEDLKKKDLVSSKKRYIKLQIKLDSWSPIYEMYNVKYKEKIDPNAFDKKMPIEKQSLNSYVDHHISIENMIGSTNDGSMRVYRNGNTIEAEVLVNENDPLAKKTANLIESGAITSNSFIFKCNKASQNWIEEENKKDVDLEVIYEDGELLSIDPVYKGFFPQCETSINYKDITKGEIEMAEQILSEVKAEEIKEAKNEVIEDKEIAKAERVDEIDIETIVNKRLESNLNVIQKALVKNEPKSLPTYEEVRSKWLNRKHLSAEENQILYKDILELEKECKERNDTTYLKSIDFTNSDGKRSHNVLGLVQKALDGTSKQNGLALIENLTSKNIISEWMGVFPELTDFATILPIIGLNTVNQPILIPDKSKATKLAEGAKSQKQGAKTANVKFEPDRYSIEVDQNNQLNSFNATLEKQTLTVKDNIRETLREAFYQNMFKDVATAFDASTYEGGASLEAVRETEESGKLTFSDLDNVVNELYAKWGNSATQGYVISMHINVLRHLEKEYFGSGNVLWKDIYNPVNRTFRGIQIIPLNISTIDNTVEASKHVVAFFLKSSVVAYGCSFVTQDSIYEMMSEDFYSRFVRLRGQIKLCDPYLNTRVIKVKA